MIGRVTSLVGTAFACAVLAGCTDTGVQGGAEEGTCDRECLLALTDQYLTALGKQDPSDAPLAPAAKFVENLQAKSIGSGLWGNAASAPARLAIAVPDVVQQQVGWLGVLASGGEPLLLALRLKIENRLIVEAEHLVTAPAGEDPSLLDAARPAFSEAIGLDERLAHKRLLEIAATYYEALDENDAALAPFAADCQRIENGTVTAGESAWPPPNAQPGVPYVASDCAGQINSQAFTYIDRIENRRMIAADPDTGLAMGFSHFRHPMDNLPYNVIRSDGAVVERNRENMPCDPFDMASAHIFKIGPDGQIHEIEAVGVSAPYDSPSGWD